MKLATLKTGGRDGRLIVVSRDLKRAVAASEVAPSLQAVLDDWHARRRSWRSCPPRSTPGAPPTPSTSTPTAALRRCRAPTSGQTVRPTSTTSSWCARRAAREMPPSFWTDPLMYQGGSDSFLGPVRPDPRTERGLGHRPRGRGRGGHRRRARWASSRTRPPQRIRLVMLVNDVSLRNLIPNELGKGFGFFQSKPSSAFSPVAVTPDELGRGLERHES